MLVVYIIAPVILPSRTFFLSSTGEKTDFSPFRVGDPLGHRRRRGVLGSTVSFSWAKVGKAKLIANPARVSRKRIFIVSSWPTLRVYWVLGLAVGDGVAAASGAKLWWMRMILSGLVIEAHIRFFQSSPSRT